MRWARVQRTHPTLSADHVGRTASQPSQAPGAVQCSSDKYPESRSRPGSAVCCALQGNLWYDSRQWYLGGWDRAEQAAKVRTPQQTLKRATVTAIDAVQRRGGSEAREKATGQDSAQAPDPSPVLSAKDSLLSCCDPSQAHDVMCLRCRGTEAKPNFVRETYAALLPIINKLSVVRARRTSVTLPSCAQGERHGV